MVAAGAAPAAPRPNPSPSPHRRRAASALSPSKSTNANANANADARATTAKPRAKAVSSRYLLAPSSKSTSTSTSTTTSSSTSTSTSASTPSRRFASPLPRRSSSVDRPRPAGAGNAAPGEPNGATTTTTRSLSVAFQGRSYFLETSKAKPTTSPSPVRRPVAPPPPSSTTPERKRPAVPERAKGSEAGHAHQRWPMSAHGFEGNPLTKSLDCSLDKKGAAVLAAVRSLRQSMVFDDGVRRASFDTTGDYLMSSDTESLSSGSNSGSQDAGTGISHRARPPTKGMSVPARFLHDAAGSRPHRFADPPGTPYTTHNSNLASSPRTAPVKKSLLLNGFASSSPLNRPARQSSPSKLAGNSSRRMSSPSRPRNSTGASASTGDQQGRSSSGYGVDGQARRRWLGGSKVDGEHLLRILCNRHLQWRCVNAQADAALASHKMTAEKDLCDAWITTLGMRKSVALKRFQLQLFRNNWKLMTVLKGQMPYLEEWSSLEMDYADSLSGIVEALTATILCLPVDGAKADIQDVKNSVGSAVDIMQTIGSSICTLLAKLSGTSILVSDLARIATQERALMDQSRELLSTLASMHVKYCSLQGQRVQTTHRRLKHS